MSLDRAQDRSSWSTVESETSQTPPRLLQSRCHSRSKVEHDEDFVHDELDPEEEFQDRIDAIKASFNKPYEIGEERLPRLPAYHPSFIKVEKLCGEVSAEALSLLEDAEYRDERTAQLIQEAKESQKIRYSPPRKIGLIGDSGVGMSHSSLINSLLDTPDIALSGADGGSCTTVITEFRQAWADQESTFMAEISLLDKGAISVIIQGHFRNYHKYKFGKRDVEDFDQEAWDEMDGLSTTALDAFRALFADRPEFANEETITAFFATANSANDRTFLEKLCQWTRDAIRTYNGQNGTIYRNASTADRLAANTEPFVKISTSTKNEDGRPLPSLWPIVEIVRVGLRCPLLERGIVIADLPGLSDVNKVRTNLTKRCIRECDFGLLVTSIARCTTDNLVHRRLGEYNRLFGDRFALVCTKLDVRYDSPMVTYLQSLISQDMPMKVNLNDLDASLGLIQKHKKIFSAHDSVDKEIKRLTKTKMTLNAKQKQETRNKINDLSLMKRIYLAMMREGLVRMRNDKVSKTMCMKYKTIRSDTYPLNVWAISNCDYNRHREGYDETEFIPLPVDVTGIPIVRCHLAKLPAKDRIKALDSHCHGRLRNIISSMELWSNRTTSHRRDELRPLVAKPRQDVERKIAEYISEMKKLLDVTILQKSKQCEKGWIQHAKEMFNQWGRWHGQTFAAWCRHAGAYQTKKQAFVSWNAELLTPAKKDLVEPWATFEQDLLEIEKKCLATLTGLVNGIEKDLTGVDWLLVEPMAPFVVSLEPKKVNLQGCLDDFFDHVKAASRNAYLDVMMVDEDQDSFLLKAISPLYDRCLAIKGPHLHVQRCMLLAESISRGEPFSEITPGIKQAIEKDINERYPELIEAIHDIFDKIIEDFNSMFVVEEVPNSHRDRLRSQIRRFVEESKTKINLQVEQELAMAMKDSE